MSPCTYHFKNIAVRIQSLLNLVTDVDGWERVRYSPERIERMSSWDITASATG